MQDQKVLAQKQSIDQSKTPFLDFYPNVWRMMYLTLINARGGRPVPVGRMKLHTVLWCVHLMWTPIPMSMSE